jgi:hypothetical protein
LTGTLNDTLIELLLLMMLIASAMYSGFIALMYLWGSAMTAPWLIFRLRIEIDRL